MKILIYEPLPDINRAKIIRDLALGLTKDGHDVLVLAEEQLLWKDEARNRFSSIDCRWTLRGLIASEKRLNLYVLQTAPRIYRKSSERNLKEQANRVEAERSRQYTKLFNELDPDICFVWNGQQAHYHSFLALAKTNNCAIHFAEHGWLPQAGTVYFDPLGVNAQSQISKSSFKDLTADEEEELESWLVRYLGFNPSKTDQVPNSIFVPLQVDTDTNIRLHSSFNSMQEFVLFLETWIPSHYSVTFRPHPMAKYNYVLDSERKNFYFDSETPITTLINRASLVVGLNSTVLIEALIRNRDVLALANGILGHTSSRPKTFEACTIHSFESQKSRLYHLTHKSQMRISNLENGGCFPEYAGQLSEGQTSESVANITYRTFFRVLRLYYGLRASP